MREDGSEVLESDDLASTHPNLYVPSRTEVEAARQFLGKLPTASAGRSSLFRFNLNRNGLARLAKEGAEHLTDSNGDIGIRGYLLYFNNKRLVLFWPAGLGFHHQILAALNHTFPGITPLDKYPIMADVKNAYNIPAAISASRLKEWSDIIESDAQ